MERRKGYLAICDGLVVDVEFNINEKKGTVAAVAKDCACLAYSVIYSDKYFRSISFICIQEGSKLRKDLLLNDTYSAVARCVEPDVFDVETGIEIATVKLYEKLNAAVASRKCILAKELLNTVDRLVDSKN